MPTPLRPTLPLLVPSTIAVALIASGAAATTPTRATYDELSAHHLEAPVPLSSVGLAWELDATRWRLEHGTVRLQRPVAGRSHGLFFAGRGAVEISIPDPVELRQLRRFLGRPDLERLDLDFDQMVLRASGGPPFDRFTAGSATAPGGAEPTFDERHRHTLTIRRLDIDRAVLAGIGDPGGDYWRADVHDTDHGWVTITFDARRDEELTVERFDKKYGLVESWLSLDRAEHRTAEGRPGGRTAPLLELAHVDVVADLATPATRRTHWIAARFEATLDLRVLQDGLEVVPLDLHPRAEVTAVTDAAGDPLEFVRDHLGGRSSAIDRETWEFALLVLPGRSLGAGESVAITVAYRMDMPKFAAGRAWYPGLRDGGGLVDLHTARLTLTTDDRHALQAMGERIDERDDGRRRTSVWEITEPAKMITFALQKRSYARAHQVDGGPEIVTVGDLGGSRLVNEERVDAVAADTVNATAYFERLLEAPLGLERLTAALIPAGHGQAFDGFLHLSNYTTGVDSAAGVERFRAHEVGHQWWGHRVGWRGYRHQWLSEGFAEYLALMFVEAHVDGGRRQFREAITAYNREVRGSLESSFSRFARPGYAALSARGLDRVGPIGHGWRARIGESPTAYSTMAYYKGAMVLHMLRTMTRLMTGSDDAFVDILRDYVRRNSGRWATTADLEAAVERRVPADWSWFFDQWVFGAEIPTYRWSHEVTGSGDQRRLRLTVEQSGVSPGFRMGVPVAIDFGGDRKGEVMVFVDEPLETFELPISGKPKKVVFNAGDAVIANVKKR